MQINLDNIVEKGVVALISLFAGGAYANWRNEPRIVKLENAMFGSDGVDGVAKRTKHTEETVAGIERRQLAHDSLLQRVADDVQEIKDFIRSQRGTP